MLDKDMQVLLDNLRHKALEFYWGIKFPEERVLSIESGIDSGGHSESYEYFMCKIARKDHTFENRKVFGYEMQNIINIFLYKQLLGI